MNRIVLLIGGNVGNTAEYFKACEKLIKTKIGCIIDVSSIYQTEAWGNTNQQDFLNQALAVETKHSPQKVLEICLDIELLLDRQRKVRWGERTIDIDIIFYNKTIIKTSRLEVPHPRYHLRNFVLLPLQDIIPDYVCPKFSLNINTLAKKSNDNLKALKLH